MRRRLSRYAVFLVIICGALLFWRFTDRSSVSLQLNPRVDVRWRQQMVREPLRLFYWQPKYVGCPDCNLQSENDEALTGDPFEIERGKITLQTEGQRIFAMGR
mgnify:CR=1 FL=1